MFDLTVDHLEQLCALNEFNPGSGTMVFFAARGCLPVNSTDLSLAPSHRLSIAQVDWTHPRCTLIQLDRAKHAFATYAGSTVPHLMYLRRASQAHGEGANQLLTGMFNDFRKGKHKPGTKTEHWAFRQSNPRPYRRTSDDFDIDDNDPVEYGNPFDNLHAAWCGSVDDDHYGSAGCQVVVGYPECPQRQGQPATDPWRTFQQRAYDLAQGRFTLVLLNGTEYERLATRGPAGMERVRFGSSGVRSRHVQEALMKHPSKFLEAGDVDGVIGPRSLRAMMQFQRLAFGPSGTDGICGPQTARALGIAWP